MVPGSRWPQARAPSRWQGGAPLRALPAVFPPTSTWTTAPSAKGLLPAWCAGHWQPVAGALAAEGFLAAHGAMRLLSRTRGNTLARYSLRLATRPSSDPNLSARVGSIYGQPENSIARPCKPILHHPPTTLSRKRSLRRFVKMQFGVCNLHISYPLRYPFVPSRNVQGE